MRVHSFPKTVFTLLLVLLTSCATSQTTTPVPQIEVAGSAQLAVSPDTGILNMNLSYIGMTFAEAINGLNAKSADISEQIRKIGFDREAIKTDNFQVRKNTKYRNGQQIDSGYVASQQLHLEFPNSVEQIRKILNQFSGSATEFDLNFGFTLSDGLKEKTQQRLITLATQDAFKKAEVISKAAGTELGGIIQIRYGNAMPSPVFNDRMLMSVKAEAMDMQGFTPSDQNFNTNILVVWKIE